MKKAMILILALLLIGAILTACGGEEAGSSVFVKDDSNSDNTAARPTAVDGTTAKTDEIIVSVSKQYDDGFAGSYADSVSTGLNGYTVYRFSREKYEECVLDHATAVDREIASGVTADFGSDYGQFAYIDIEKKAVIIGVNAGKYGETKEQTFSADCAGKAFKVFMALEEPVREIQVNFVNADNMSEVYGSFNVSAE